MSKCEVVLIDYGMGNLLSVRRAMEHCGAEVIMTADPAVIIAASLVVLPGVGAFANGMAELRRLGLDVALREVATKGTPLLGICLGMQMLLDESEEFGFSEGLGLIEGKAVPVPSIASDGKPQRIPHIGWNELSLPLGHDNWGTSLMSEVKPGESVYFVHSFMADPCNSDHRIADCAYGGMQVSAAIGRDNIVGCQFHPEKSGEVGLKVLRSFLTL